MKSRYIFHAQKTMIRKTDESTYTSTMIKDLINHVGIQIKNQIRTILFILQELSG